MPELRQLRVFVAVAEELNFTRAARRLSLAQQAVSKTVRQLESELGVELLERTTHEVRLTPAGAALLEDGRQALAAAEGAFEHAREAGHGLSGTVRVGVSPAVGPLDRDDAVRALRDGAPELSVSLREIRPSEIGPLLGARRVELVLARAAGGGPGLESAALRPTPVQLCVPADHRLAGTRTARLADLDGERLLTWSPTGTPYTDLLLARLAAAGTRVEPVEARVTGGFTVPELADAGAVALLPAGWPPSPGTELVALEDDVTLPLVVLWRTGPTPAAVRRIRAAMTTPGHMSRPGLG